MTEWWQILVAFLLLTFIGLFTNLLFYFLERTLQGLTVFAYIILAILAIFGYTYPWWVYFIPIALPFLVQLLWYLPPFIVMDWIVSKILKALDIKSDLAKLVVNLFISWRIFTDVRLSELVSMSVLYFWWVLGALFSGITFTILLIASPKIHSTGLALVIGVIYTFFIFVLGRETNVTMVLRDYDAFDDEDDFLEERKRKEIEREGEKVLAKFLDEE